MSTNIVYNGVTYTIPATDDVAWGDAVSNFLIAIPSGMLTKVGGSWHLTGSDLDFGNAYGVASIYFKSKTATLGQSGFIRMAKTDKIVWRNNDNSGDNYLVPNTLNMPTWNGVELGDISTSQTFTNKTIDADLNSISNIRNDNIAADAAIAYSKLNISDGEIPWAKIASTGQIVDADVSATAAIAGTKIDPDFGTQDITTSGSIKLGTTFKVSLHSDPNEDYELHFPVADGTAGQALVKSTGGELEWASVPGLTLNEYNILVGGSANTPQSIDTNSIGDVKVDETNGITIKSDVITNAMIKSNAAIAFSKLEATPLALSGGTMTGLINLDETGIRFDTVTASPGSPAVGQTYWDDQDKTIATKLSDDVTLQHGQEMQLYVLNNSGGNIPNGSVVYINSANAARGTIRKAQANAAATADLTIGMTTTDINDGDYGYITTFGHVRGVTTNVDGDSQAVTDGTPIYLSATTAGEWVKTPPSAPNHRVRIGQVLNAGGGASGTILVSVEHGSHLDELHDVKITSAADNDTLVYDSSAGYWKNRTDTKQYTLEETGFVDPDGVTVTYDSTERKITLTHATEIIYLNKGRKVSLGASWTSAAHGTDLDKKYFLYFNASDAEEWFESFQGFDYGVYVAQANYLTANKFALRECHGLMQWQVWGELHRTIGTYLVSGGLVPAASWTANTYTTAAVTPAVEEAVIADEDLPTTIAAFTDGSTYTRLHFDSGEAVITTGSTLPFPNDGTNIQYNQNPSSGTALTAITTNARFVNVYDVMVPVTADAESQAYRHLWLTGQQIYTTLAAAQGEDFRTVNTGDLASSFPEFIPYARITYERQVAGGSTTTFNARIPTNGVSYLVGSKAALASVAGFTPTDHNTLTGRSDADSHPASAITNTPSGNLSATTVQAALDELQSDIDTRAPATAPTIDNGLYLNHESSVTTPASGKVAVYPKSDNNLYIVDSNGIETPVGSSTGQGEKNYITNPSAKTATTGWTASDGNITIARTTTTANLPREFTTGTAISLTSSTDEAYAYYRFSLDDCDLSKKLKIVLSFINGDTSDAWRIEMWKNSTAAYDGTYTELALSTDSSGDSYLPVTTGDYKTTFDADTVAYLELRIVHNGTNSDVLYISDVIVGPGSVVQGAVVGDWVSFTPTGSWSTNTTYTGKYRRVGDSADFQIKVATTGAPTSATLTVNLPSGMTIDTTKLANAAGGVSNLIPFSTASFLDAGTANILGAVRYTSTTAVQPSSIDDSAAGLQMADVTQAAPFTFANNDYIQMNFSVPIAEWAGSGTVNVAQNDVEYAWNSSTSTTDDTSSFGYGPAGALIQNFAPSGTNVVVKGVRFQTPIQNSDMLVFEIDNGSGKWQAFQDRIGGFSEVDAGTTAYGYRLEITGTSTASVSFFSKATVGVTWTDLNTWSWRVRKTSAGAAVGFGIVQPGVSAGLVSASGLPGRTDGIAVPAGYVGQIIYESSTATATSSATTIKSKTLPPGNWRITVKISAYSTAGTTFIAAGILTSESSFSYNDVGCGAGDTTTSGFGGLYLERVIGSSSDINIFVRHACGGANVNQGQLTEIYYHRIS